MSGRMRLYACMLGSTVLVAGPATAAEMTGSTDNGDHYCARGASVCDFSAALNDNPNAPEEDRNN